MGYCSVMAFNIFSSDYGFMNRMITSAGGKKISFYTKPEYWPFILVFFNVWKNIGYGSVMYLAAIMGIDTSVYEQPQSTVQTYGSESARSPFR